MKVGDLVRFCDYDTDYKMRIGVVVEILHNESDFREDDNIEPWEDWVSEAFPLARVAYDGRTQAVPIPQNGQRWMTIVSTK